MGDPGAFRRSIPVLFVLFTVFACLAAPSARAQQPASLVVDLNTVQEDSSPYFTLREFSVLGTTVFFVHNDGIHGIELWKSDGTEAGTAMVKDVCPGACMSAPFDLTPSNGVLYFAADDGVHGRELWRTDGTAAGTFLVADVNPGLPHGLTSLFDLGGVLFFEAYDGVHGNELWKTDGTAAGTVLVADIVPGAFGSNPSFVLNAGNGKLLFYAEDLVHGREPWLTDGTAAGTVLLKDVNPGPAASYFDSYDSDPHDSEADAYALGGGTFLFLADDGAHGAEPWISNGTAAGTVLLKDVNPGSNGSEAQGYAALGSSILFGAYDDTVSWELWATDGTTAGTHLVKDIHPLSSGSLPRQLTPLGGRLFFAAADAAGYELWATDGTAAGTVRIKDINPGTNSGILPFVPTVIRPGGAGLLFFANDGAHGDEIWTSDGTPAGTRLVRDVEPGPASGISSWVSGLTVVGSTAYFQGFTTGHGFELWKSDGTETGTAEVKNIATTTSSLSVPGGYLESMFGRIGGRFLFDAEDGVSGLEPWATDGTAASAQQLADIVPGPFGSGPSQLYPSAGFLVGSPVGEIWKTDGTPAGTYPLVPPGTFKVVTPLAAFGSSWYFAGLSSGDSELWKTDGTTAGTQRVRDIRPGLPDSNPNHFTVLGSSLLFSADDGPTGTELWKTDGTEAGTTRVADLVPGLSGSDPREITPLGSRAVFNAFGPSSLALWATDGTAPGTVLLHENAIGLGRLGDIVLFTAFQPLTGQELWKTDGTAAGTVLLKDIQAGPGSSSFFHFYQRALAGNSLFFLADDGIHGTELWKTDGTTAGTVLVKDIWPGSRSSDVRWMTIGHSRLFFVAGDGVHGRELWVSDGTEAGTRMVKDVAPGPGSSVIQHLKVVGRTVLFNATDGVHGVEPWKSDGTEAGTVMIQDVAPGAASSSAVGFFSLFPNVYFAANDNVAGFELWSFPRSVLGATFADVPTNAWAWPYVEAVADAGLTTGCGESLYCPTQLVTRAEMAVFVLRVLHGASYVPPAATGTVFADVPAGYWAAAWIEQLAAEGITSGCGGSPALFCPESATARDQMAVFLLRALHGAGYTPPPATGTVFTDVPASYWAAPWIEQLAAEGITTGCGTGLYCPGDPVSRDQMAVFLTRALNLPLP